MFWEADTVSKSYSVFVTESNKLSLTSSHLVVLPVLFFSAVNWEQLAYVIPTKNTDVLLV